MAIYPCDNGNHRYPQPQQSIYLTRIIEDDILTRTTRLCPLHFRNLVQTLGNHLDDITEVTESGHVCKSCDGPLEVRVYCRAFPTKSEEMPFAGEFCTNCWHVVTQHLQFDLWRSMRPRT